MEVKLIKLKYNLFDISLKLTAYHERKEILLDIALCVPGDGGSGGKGIIASGDGGEGGAGGESRLVYQGGSLRTNTSGFQGKGVTVPRAGTEEPGVPEDTGQGRLYCRKRVKRTTLLTMIYRQMKKTF